MTFNAAAMVLGPVWYGLRGIWNWSFAFVILEAFACVQIGRGFWGDLAVEERERLSSVEAQIGLRQDQLDAAVNRGDANVDVFERNIQSLQDILADIQLDIQQAEDSRMWIIVLGIGMLLAVKLLQGVLANTLLERRYSEWLSDRTNQVRGPCLPGRLEPALRACSSLFRSMSPASSNSRRRG